MKIIATYIIAMYDENKFSKWKLDSTIFPWFLNFPTIRCCFTLSIEIMNYLWWDVSCCSMIKTSRWAACPAYVLQSMSSKCRLQSRVLWFVPPAGWSIQSPNDGFDAIYAETPPRYAIMNRSTFVLFVCNSNFPLCDLFYILVIFSFNISE